MHRWPRFLPPSWIALALVAALGGCQALSNDTNKAAEKPKPKAEAPPDWPNLARYRDENARLAAAPDGAIRVVFMGDSITDFWPKVGRFFPGKDYIDRGISGQTTPQMLVRFRPDVIDLKPRGGVILAG